MMPFSHQTFVFPPPDPEPTQGLRRFHLRQPLFAGEITEVVAAGCYVEGSDGEAVLRLFTPEMFLSGEAEAVRVNDFWVVFFDGQQNIGPAETFIRQFVTHKAPPGMK